MSNPFIIAADEIKTYFPKYSDKQSSIFHSLSTKVADKMLFSAIQFIPQSVVILGGGTASGKTEYLSQYIIQFGKKGGIFFDGTLPTLKGAEIKIKRAIKFKRKIEIHYIFPRSIREAFTVFLNRSRKFSPDHFYNTHSQSRKTVLEVAKKFPEINIRLIESSFTKTTKTMIFEEKIFQSKQEQIEFLCDFQYTQEEIITKTV